MRKLSYISLIFLAGLFVGHLTHAGCGAGKIDKKFSDLGFKTVGDISVQGDGGLNISGRKFHFELGKGWCRLDEQGGCAFPLRTGERSKVVGLTLQVQAQDLFLSETGSMNRIHVYPVILAQGGAIATASTNITTTDDKNNSVAGNPVFEAVNEITIGARDPETGDISAFGSAEKIKKVSYTLEAPRISVTCSGEELLSKAADSIRTKAAAPSRKSKI